jgi:hypothetical protein
MRNSLCRKGPASTRDVHFLSKLVTFSAATETSHAGTTDFLPYSFSRKRIQPETQSRFYLHFEGTFDIRAAS